MQLLGVVCAMVECGGLSTGFAPRTLRDHERMALGERLDVKECEAGKHHVSQDKAR